ncbi:hypothetical protein SLE2022_026780 [Rubroshorea leprosula]
MCMNSSTPISRSDFSYSFSRRRSSKRHNVRVRHLNRWRRSRRGAVGASKMMVKDGVAKMEIKNLKLYMENQSIREENERLRRKALLLHQENQSLLAQLQKKPCNPQTT